MASTESRFIMRNSSVAPLAYTRTETSCRANRGLLNRAPRDGTRNLSPQARRSDTEPAMVRATSAAAVHRWVTVNLAFRIGGDRRGEWHRRTADRVECYPRPDRC